MEKIVEYIVKNLVQTPDEVNVSSREDGDITVIEVVVREDELGKVIGKNGKKTNEKNDNSFPNYYHSVLPFL